MRAVRVAGRVEPIFVEQVAQMTAAVLATVRDGIQDAPYASLAGVLPLNLPKEEAHWVFPPTANNRVRLTFGLERKDRYDRFLAFVWDGDVMLNEELVRAGLAFARLDYRYSGAMKRRLAAAQDEARQAGRGVWSKSDTQPVNPP